MAGKYLTGTYASGYALSGSYSSVTVGPAGTINGAGLLGASSGADTILNLGTVKGSTSGIALAAGGLVTNGSTSDTTALVNGGQIGVSILFGTGSIANDATIQGNGEGVYLGATGVVTNGAAVDSRALIQGGYGVVVTGGGTVVNYGTIRGMGGTAVLLQSADDVLVLEAGSRLIGNAGGGGGTLELGSGGGAGTLSSIANYRDFGAIDVVSSASWTVASLTIASGTTLTDAGTLTVGSGTLVDRGALTVTGSLALPVTITLSDGSLTVGMGATIGASGTTVTAVGTGSPVYGLFGAYDTVTNDGTIFGDFFSEQPKGAENSSRTAAGPAGIYLQGGGLVTNGAPDNTAALVTGGNYGVFSGGIQKHLSLSTAAVKNYGTIYGTYVGVYLQVEAPQGPGTVTNGSADDTAAMISGGSCGVQMVFGALTLVNYGTIASQDAAIAITDGGLVRNGSTGDTAALIAGTVDGVYGKLNPTVVNYGTVQSSLIGIYSKFGASVFNGSAGDTTALIEGGNGAGTLGAGVFIAGTGPAPSTVVNNGTVVGYLGIVLYDSGGLVMNGDAGDTTALVDSGTGTFSDAVAIQGVAGTIVNYGTLEGYLFGAEFTTGGRVVNGSAVDTAALIEIGTFALGVGIAGGGATVTVINYGTIAGYFAGVGLTDGGRVVNGSSVDTTALIEGGAGTSSASTGVIAKGATTTVVNYGTVTAGLIGVDLVGGLFVNGSVGDTAARVETGAAPAGSLDLTGFVGVTAPGASTIVNYATIAAGGVGVVLGLGGRVTNGSSGDKAALIEGLYGVAGPKASSFIVDNFGTIDGTGGTAVYLASSADVLMVEAGSTLVGLAVGSTSTLDLAGGAGAGTLTGFGSVYTGFAQIAVLAGTTWTLAGANTVASGSTLTGSGRLLVTGSLENAGSLAGRATISSGVLVNETGGTIGGTLLVAGSVENEGTITGAVTVSSGVLDNETGGMVGGPLTVTGSVENEGTITGAVTVSSGMLVNEAGGTIGALNGVQGIGGTIENDGTMEGSEGAVGAAGSATGDTGGTGGSAGTVSAAGSLVNGGLIEGATGGAGGAGTTYGGVGGVGGAGLVLLAGGYLLNDATIDGGTGGAGGAGGTRDGNGGVGGAGVDVGAGSRLTNEGTIEGGSGGAGQYTVSGGAGVVVSAGGYVANHGTIGGSIGVYFSHGGVLANGSAGDTTAQIDAGPRGVGVSSKYGDPTVANFGTISGADVFQLYDGASVTNGSAGDTVALIDAVATGVGLGDHAGPTYGFTITNYGTMTAGGAVVFAIAPVVIENVGPGAYMRGGSYVSGAQERCGVLALFGGTVINSGTIYGGDAGVAMTAGTVINAGTIDGFTNGVSLETGSNLTNGAGALIEGGIGVGGMYGVTITDSGTIDGTGGTAVLFELGDNLLILKGGALVGTAVGGGGTLEVAAGAGAGTLSGFVGFALAEVLAGAEGILTGSGTVAAGGTLLDAGTLVVSGSLSADGAVVVTGSLESTGAINGEVTLSGGVFTNGAGGFASSRYGAVLGLAGKASTVTNLGTIRGADAVLMHGGGLVTNGSASDTVALLQSEARFYGVPGTIVNFGTIEGVRAGNIDFAGIYLGAGGDLANGTTSDTAALVQGGVRISGGAGMVANDGTIDRGAFGVYLGAGGRVTNGSGADKAALVDGGVRIENGAGTVVNYGTISGTGAAVVLGAPGGVLVVEAGSTLLGQAVAEGGTLEFGAGGGAGTIAGLGTSAVYSGFSHYQVNAGATWTLAGSHTIASGQSLVDDGALILTAPLAVAGSFAEGAGATLTVASATTLTLSGTSTVAGTIGGAATLAFVGGKETLASGAAIATSAWSLSGDVAVTVNTKLTYAGAFADSAGTTVTVGSGDKLALSGTATVTGTIGGAGTLAFAGGKETLASGAAVTASAWTVWDGAAVAVNAKLTYAGAFADIAGTTVTVGSGDKLALSGTSTIGGTIGGAGTLAFAGGNEALGSGAAVTASAWTVWGGAAVAVDATLTYAGAFSESAGTAVTVGSGDKLVLTGTSTVAGTIGGAGTLAFAGGKETLASGAAITASAWIVWGGAVATLDESLAYAGTFDVETGTTFTVAKGDTLTLSGTATVAGTLAGAGTIAFAAGADALGPGAALTVAGLGLSGAKTILTVGTTLSYAGKWSETAGTLTVAKNASLTLTGAADRLAGTIDGAGSLDLDGGSSLAGLVFGGTLAVDNHGTLAATGQLTIGDATASVAHLTNQAGGVLDIEVNTGIGRGTAASTFANAGLLEKTGDKGTSTIAIAVTNTGTIEAAAGRLDLVDGITGTGRLVVEAGATLDAGGAVASGQTVDLAATKATLVIDDAAGFKAALSGFGGTDRIDLTGIAFGSKTKLTFAAHTLTVTDGTHTATLTLFGQYVAAGFHDAKDGTGTLVTYTPPPAVPPQIATSH